MFNGFFNVIQNCVFGVTDEQADKESLLSLENESKPGESNYV